MDSTARVKTDEVLKSIGDRLKKARESKNLTLAQAQIKTRIHSKVLSALEEGRIDEILGATYAKGFLKKYSAFLGLNSDDILNEYLTVHPDSSQEAFSPRLIPQKKLKLRMERRSRPYFVIVLIVALLVLSFGMFLKRKAQEAPKAGSRLAKQNISAGAAKIQGVKPAISKKIAMNVRSSAVPSLKKEQAKIAKEKALPAFSIPRGEPLLLKLKVKRNVLVQVARDGNIIFQNVLREGSTETVKAKEKINLAIGNIQALELVLNGRPLEHGLKGKVRDMEITHSGIKIKK